MSIEQQAKASIEQQEQAIAAAAFVEAFRQRHPATRPKQVLAVYELSGVSGVVSAENVPEGTLDLLSDEDRLSRALRIGKALGGKG